MISRILFWIQGGVTYIKEHPQVLFILVLLLVMPLLFLYSGQQFLDVGRENQDRLQKDRIGLMQDVFGSMLNVSNFDVQELQPEIERIATLNPDITDFKIVRLEGEDFMIKAALATSTIGVAEEYIELYRNAVVRLDESLIFEAFSPEGRVWLTYRAMQDPEGQYYFIYTQVSLQAIDALFTSREHGALYSLGFVYIFFLLLAFWHVRMTDYRFLYTKAQKANAMKDLFTNMIAHELRAPLTAIRGYASMLDEKTQNPEEKKYAGRIKDSSERLLAIVNDLLDVARIQSGKLSVENQETDISKVIIAVTDELRISADEKDITLTYVNDGSEHMVTADPKRLHQALTNLVSNAIKYTKQGTIEFSVEEKRSKVELRVKDTGMGISSDDQKKLFAPFFRVQSDDVSKITGTGLGMWITKQLIELMGGRINVESIRGVGTHVVVTLEKKKL